MMAPEKKLRAALEEIYHYRRLVLVLGMLGDKEREKVVGELAPLAGTTGGGAVVIARPNSPPGRDWGVWPPRPTTTRIEC